ncbi:RNA polymerase sigma factor [Sphingobacterium faecale]|uniref:Sigma-70 family RNA polymerase sigma factor n=1 Tax=Sphingobacterium faecale TaxID=2803775 RepID=A0ABS1R6I9_9SPHI|nr:sigma-70 family RNA polymerase sigma factor [Sphingobacterium faecale]MBL1410322.1 sigma-70 family RNA polymerase sigma factor [Sphingobacterium faecale]
MYKDTINSAIQHAFIRGERQAFEHIYRAFSRPLYRRILYLVKDPDEADEILHNLFLKIWSSHDQIDPDKNLFAYFMQAANSMSIDQLRKNIRTQAIHDKIGRSGDDDSICSVEENYISKEEWQILESAIEQLPPQRRLIFRLCKIEGKSYKEVSEVLSISTATISNQLVLAMKSLRQFVIQHQKEIMLYCLFLEQLRQR